MWKLTTHFDVLSGLFAKFYNLSEHLVVDKVIVKFKGWVIFRQYIPKKHKHFSIKIYELSDMTGYTCEIRVHFGKNTQDCS
jgi:hypothetical protein